MSSDVIGYTGCAALSLWAVRASEAPMVMGPVMFAITMGLLTTLAAWIQGLYQTIVRFVTVSLILNAAIAAGFVSIAGSVYLYAVAELDIAARWAITYWALASLYVLATRHFARAFLLRTKSDDDVQNVLVYGAGDAGAALARALDGAADFNPVAFVDDDTNMHRKRIGGLSVYSPMRLGTLIKEHDVSRVLMAMPRASRRLRRKVLERLSEYPVHVQTIPDFQDIVSGRAQVDEIRDVDVKDLLGRDAVPADPNLLDRCILGKNVMVTGAGGSIGSELCRQILRLRPERLVLFEISEASLYQIDREVQKIIREQGFGVEVISLLGSAHHEDRVREALKTFEIHTVYHAAAYKHVPIVERNVFEGIHNNVFGTFHTLRAAVDAGVESFVLISTDKAVNPTNVMGATKRFAELVLQSYQDSHPETRMCMVRFGNVLESSGSVVPLFKEQIRSGGPITVTHRDIIRYFMTIPEAAELVIQAGSMAEGGDVFVLDMGKPVRIHDLACRMVNLMGLTVQDDNNPDGDIEIKYIGLRPAEKLYEELLIGANVTGTEHPRILRAHEDYLPAEQLEALLQDLMETSLAQRHEEARQILLKAVKEYKPENRIDDLVWLQKSSQSGSDGTIVDFPKKQA